MSFLNNLYIQKFHASKIEKFGSDNAKSLAWFDEASQLKRFEVLKQIGDLNNSTILDAGCGNGDFCIYLSQYFSGFTYHGFDIVSEFLDNAIERTNPIGNVHFYLADFMAVDLPQADYVFACGSLNYKNSDPEFIYKAITRLYNQCDIALGFNLLREVQNPDGFLTAYDPEQIVAFCQTLSPHVVFKDQYAEDDFTILMSIKPPH